MNAGSYVRLTPEQAAQEVSGVEVFQAGKWCAVDSVTPVSPGDYSCVGVRFASGGIHVAPGYHFTFRKATNSQKGE